MCRGSGLAQATNPPRSPISSAVAAAPLSDCLVSPLSSPAPPISSFPFSSTAVAPPPLSFVLPSLLLPLPPRTTLRPVRSSATWRQLLLDGRRGSKDNAAAQGCCFFCFPSRLLLSGSSRADGYIRASTREFGDGLLTTYFSEWADVRAVATMSSLNFIDRSSLPSDIVLYTDDDEWSTWKKIGDEVLHIELRKWADIMVIAPLSANTLAKIAGGLCDNLLTCIVRAWDYSKPLFVAPAMNTLMWNNPFTERHLQTINQLGIILIPPVTKRLACGDYGNGAMAETSQIYTSVRLACKTQPHDASSSLAVPVSNNRPSS